MKILFKSIEQSPNEERQRKKSCMIILQQLCVHPVVKKCMLEALDLLALHNMKGRVHAVNHKRKKTNQNPV
jgi:hypothetical protein